MKNMYQTEKKCRDIIERVGNFFENPELLTI